MDSRLKFKQYLRLKDKLQVKYRGYDLAKIVAVDLISVVFFGARNSLRRSFFIFFSLDLSGLKSLNSTSVLATLGRYGGRKDYYEILDYVTSNANIEEVFDFSRCKFKFRVNLRNIWYSFKDAFFSISNELSLSDRFFLYQRLTFYRNVIDEFEKNDLSKVCTKYLAFSSVHDVECIFTQYFQKRNIPTYSLQHGLYFIFNEFIPLDAVVYENFVSDYHLTWGQYSLTELKSFGIPAEKLIVGGYPRRVDRSNKIPSSISIQRCIVFLARVQYEHSNKELLLILKEFAKNNPIVEFHFKLHPSLDYSLYASAFAESGMHLIDSKLTLSALLLSSNYDVSIAVNTAAYYESYIYHIPSLRFWDKTFENSASVDDDLFTNLQELSQHIDRLNSITDTEEYFSKVETSLDYIIGINTNNYITILN